MTRTAIKNNPRITLIDADLIRENPCNLRIK